MQSRAIKSDRRRFLKRLGMATGASALLALSGRRKGLAEEDADTRRKQPRHDQGYRLTAHIRKYYEIAGQ